MYTCIGVDNLYNGSATIGLSSGLELQAAAWRGLTHQHLPTTFTSRQHHELHHSAGFDRPAMAMAKTSCHLGLERWA